MKLSHTTLLNHFDATDRAFSILTSVMESKTVAELHKIPSHSILIIQERLDLINKSIGDIYKEIEKYDN